MSKKIFSLIHGDQLHIAPKTKALSSEDFSLLLSAEEMLKKVKEDAKHYIREVAEEAEKSKEIGRKEGFEAGFIEWTKKIEELEEEIRSVHEEVNKVVVPVALEAAKKIVGREMELNEKTVVDIVATNLKAVSHHRKIKIFVSQDDLEKLESNREQLRRVFDHLESLTLAARGDIKSGGCVIETEGGIINAQLENKWQILEEAFSTLMKSKT